MLRRDRRELTASDRCSRDEMSAEGRAICSRRRSHITLRRPFVILPVTRGIRATGTTCEHQQELDPEENRTTEIGANGLCYGLQLVRAACSATRNQCAPPIRLTGTTSGRQAPRDGSTFPLPTGTPMGCYGAMATWTADSRRNRFLCRERAHRRQGAMGSAYAMAALADLQPRGGGTSAAERLRLRDGGS